METGNNTDIETNINMELASISDWLKVNKLSLSLEKSKYMKFHTPQKKVAQLRLKIDNTLRDRVY